MSPFMLDLEATRHAVSPRYAPTRTPWRSILTHGAVLAFWLAVVARAFGAPGLLSWSAGIAYVSYDTILLLFTFSQTLALMRHRPADPKAPLPSVTVLIAAHNEAAVLGVTLNALAEQSSPAERVVVVDDGSYDATAATLNQFGLTEPPIGQASTCGAFQWLRLPHGGKASALNCALQSISTDMVMTVDADTVLAPDAIEQMRKAFAANAALVAATGILTPRCELTLQGQFLQWFQTHEYLRNCLSRFAWMQQDGLLLISGAFAAFRRTALLEVGAFDTGCLVEDYELIHRLRRYSALNRLNWTTAVIGEARALTDAPSTIGAFLRQRRRWFGGFLQTQFWYRDMVANPKFGHTGTRMLPIKAIDTFQPIFGLTAIIILVTYLVRGQISVLLPAGLLISAKIAFDLGFYVWSVHLYRRWVGGSGKVQFWTSLVAAVTEPFSFQIFRHLGAALGWVSFLTGRMTWGKRTRSQAIIREA